MRPASPRVGLAESAGVAAVDRDLGAGGPREQVGAEGGGEGADVGGGDLGAEQVAPLVLLDPDAGLS